MQFLRKGKPLLPLILALTFAKSGKKVIIVDSDLRLPLIHKVFNRNDKPGLTNVLVNDKKIPEVIKRADDIHSNLYFIPSGPIPPNPSELLGSGRMKAIIKELKEEADMIIFDSPPVIWIYGKCNIGKPGRRRGINFKCRNGNSRYSQASQSTFRKNKSKNTRCGA